MANFRKLLGAAVVLPEREDWMQAQPWMAQVLGVGSVVSLLPQSDSPVTGTGNEIHVQWTDCVGRTIKGWLAKNTPLAYGGNALSFVGRHDLKVGPWDELREKIFNNGQTAKQYLCCEVTPEDFPQLKLVIRELGGRIKNSDDEGTIITRAIRLITGEELTMDDVQEERESAAPARSTKKSGKKGGKKSSGSAKAKGSVKVKRQPMAVTVGTSLLSLGLTGKAKQHATALSKGNELGKKQLIELRDGINEAASSAREGKKGKVASQLSAANRLVRRLARSR